MKHIPALVLTSLLPVTCALAVADQAAPSTPATTETPSAPALAVPGKVLYENKLNTAPGEPWKVLKGAWELRADSWRVAEKPDDKHAAVARLPNKLGDFVLEYEFKFEGAKSTSLSINSDKGHLARVMIKPSEVTVQKDDSDHEGPDKGKVFAKLPATFEPGTWHKVRLEMVGETMFARVDNLRGWGSDPSFAKQRLAGLTVGGQSVEFRNFKICEATLNPAWKNVPMPGKNAPK